MKRINMNIPIELLNKLDKIAKEKYMNRTELIKLVLLEYVNINEKWNF